MAAEARAEASADRACRGSRAAATAGSGHHRSKSSRHLPSNHQPVSDGAKPELTTTFRGVEKAGRAIWTTRASIEKPPMQAHRPWRRLLGRFVRKTVRQSPQSAATVSYWMSVTLTDVRASGGAKSSICPRGGRPWVALSRRSLGHYGDRVDRNLRRPCAPAHAGIGLRDRGGCHAGLDYAAPQVGHGRLTEAGEEQSPSAARSGKHSHIGNSCAAGAGKIRAYHDGREGLAISLDAAPLPPGGSLPWILVELEGFSGTASALDERLPARPRDRQQPIST
jgi:hypothetical protein